MLTDSNSKTNSELNTRVELIEQLRRSNRWEQTDESTSRTSIGQYGRFYVSGDGEKGIITFRRMSGFEEEREQYSFKTDDFSAIERVADKIR